MAHKKIQKNKKKESTLVSFLNTLAEDLHFLIEKITSGKRILKLRAKILWIATLLLYGMVVFGLFYQRNIILSILYLLAFLVFYHFFFIEIYRYKLKILFFVLLLVTIIEVVLFGFDNTYITLAILTLNIGIFLLSDYLNDETTSRITFFSRSYFVSGGYGFTVFMTLTYCFTLIGTYKTFPFTCQNLSENSQQFIDIVSQPFKLGMQEVSHIKSSVSNFLENNKISDIVKIGNDIEVKDMSQGSLSFVGKIESYKKDVIDQVLKDKDLVDMGTCDFLIKEIQKRYNNPTFTFSVILLSFLLLYPFLRLATYIVSILGYITYHILRIFNIYRKKESNKKVEEIR